MTRLDDIERERGKGEERERRGKEREREREEGMEKGMRMRGENSA